MTDVSEIKWLRGALYGAISYVTAMMLVAVWYFLDYSTTPINGATTSQKIGLGMGSFYNGQFVGVGPSPNVYPEISYLDSFGSAGRGFLTTPMYMAIPILAILLIAGIFVYTEAEIDTSDRLAALLSGTSLAPGYVIISLVVAVGFGYIAGSSFSLPIGMVIISGVLYPVVVGGFAGLAANELKGYVGDSSAAPGVEENM